MSDHQTRVDLIKLHQELGDDDFGKLKYLTKDYIPHNKQREIHSSLDLFTCLEEKRCIVVKDGKCDFIVECLHKMERKDLIKAINGDIGEIEKKLKSGQSIFSPYRSFLFLMSECMGEDEVQEIKRFLKERFHVKKRALDGVNVWGLLNLVEQHVQSDLPILEEICGLFEDDDVKLGLEKYKIDISSHGCGMPREMDTSAHVLTTNNVNDGDRIPIPVSDQNTDIPSTDAASSIPVDDQDLNQPPTAMCYTMGHPAGLCIIINNQHFDNSSVFSTRDGSDVDADMLYSTFERFGFEIRVHENISGDEIQSFLHDYAVLDHSAFSALVVCILSHGSSGVIIGRDGRSVAIDKLTSYFRADVCPTLTGKPKLFFIQACQGHDTQGVWYGDPQSNNNVERDVQSVPEANNSEEIRTSDPSILPLDVDFLLGMATIPNYVSYRTSQGSFYIQSLIKNLRKYSPSEDLNSILTIVNHDVAEMSGVRDGRIVKQIPEPRNRLRKKVYFTPVKN